ncbi:MAG: cation diffusion facilitator family transporter, partial [Gammaproteobacteria bacterium]|nr:cation diffusion facilitator family transporter [Gammaproteobacteria bacterium]
MSFVRADKCGLTAVHLQDRDSREGARHRLAWVLVITAGFMALEFAAALFIGSLALLADAGHMLRDVMGLSIAFAASRLADLPTDARATYGYQRYEVLGAFINGLLLTGMIVFIFGEAARRLMQPEGIDAWPMLIIGMLGLVV